MPQFEKKNNTEDGRAETAVQQPRTRTSFTVPELATIEEALSYYIVHAQNSEMSALAGQVRIKVCAARMRLNEPLVERVADSYSLFEIDAFALEVKRDQP